jgi:farnesol dehydrogenase
MNILVTGATGFIGIPLTRSLAVRGHAVRILSRPTSDLTPFAGLPIDVRPGDILDPDSLDEACAGCEAVFHLAGYAKNWAPEAGTYFRVNVLGLRHVLAAARRRNVGRIVFTSTSVTCGPSSGRPVTESDARRVDFFTEYERTKFLAELEARRAVRAGLDVVMVNPTRVFGPGALTEGNSVTRMIRLYLAGKWRLILGNGRAVGNYGFIDDVVAGHRQALARGRPGEKYLLGGEDLDYESFFRTLAFVSGCRRRMVHVPPRLALAVAEVEALRAACSGHYPSITPSWVRTFLADWAFSSEKARRELGYTTTPFARAVEKTVRWLRPSGATQRSSDDESLDRLSQPFNPVPV